MSSDTSSSLHLTGSERFGTSHRKFDLRLTESYELACHVRLPDIRLAVHNANALNPAVP
ncbi:uncharacterized protein L969DRAFT_51823 [Mixia osmundae IAM 14324]|uniref:uncharacterized protein n=1 Tax=Mixia osmundae (strain CBS 9802 / IAM 14324 / JCM 22182 / KY 12970) TaxID=764103 RepID=UPI0004A55003|nr:uncharacterized protein L969DRAFT_51823 [Mixia osmundae IAM 14324]KEI37878.1 hypothetical protein L969DRAFT_51823 [Mixia osmundae IAM 14324]